MTDQEPNLRQELFVARIAQLQALGFETDAIAAYILAEETNGVLKPNSPPWLIRSEFFRTERGECPSMTRYDTLRRIVKALIDLEDARTSAEVR